MACKSIAVLLACALGASTACARDATQRLAVAQYSRSFQDSVAAVYRWFADHPDSADYPSSAELGPYGFAPWMADGYELRLSQPSAGVVRVCLLARATSALQLSAFMEASRRAQAALSRSSDCAEDGGQEARQPGMPRTLAMARTLQAGRVVTPAVLPAEPAVGVDATNPLELSSATPQIQFSIVNNTAEPLALLQAVASDERFQVGSTCQAPVPPQESCEVEVALDEVTRKTVARLRLTFSNGAQAFVSVRATP